MDGIVIFLGLYSVASYKTVICTAEYIQEYLCFIPWSVNGNFQMKVVHQLLKIPSVFIPATQCQNKYN